MLEPARLVAALPELAQGAATTLALTACSALQSNNNSFKPIRYRIDPTHA